MQSIYVYNEAIETKGRSVEEVYYFYLFIMFKSVLGFDVSVTESLLKRVERFHSNMLRQYSAHTESFGDCPER